MTCILGDFPSLGCSNKILSIQLKTECGSQFTNKLEGMFKVRIMLCHLICMSKISD